MHPLKKFIKSRNLRVKEFSKAIGISREYLHDIMSWRKSPSPEVAQKIERATRGEIKKEWLIFPDDYREEIEAYIEGKELAEAGKR